MLAAGAVAAAVVLPSADGGAEPRADGPVRAVQLRECRGLGGDAGRECLIRAFSAVVAGRKDARPAVEAITRSARREGAFAQSNCHGAMHTVGRTYAREARVTLATLMDHLPRSNDPGCSAGFAHGMVTAVAGDIDPEQPREAAAVCAQAGSRYQRYSCVHGFGHAFMRLYNDQLEPALELCSALGPDAAADCAQGGFHDYWFAVVGADDATLAGDAVKDPRTLCGAQAAAFVRPCWYRAYIDNRPEGFQVAAPEDLDALCDGLAGLQRGACITAASVIGPPDPAAQLDLCSQLDDARDVENCVKGTKVQNLLGSPTRTYVQLIERCERFRPGSRTACRRWMGKTLAVITDGTFAREGCPALRSGAARRACAEGAAAMDEALVTFS